MQKFILIGIVFILTGCTPNYSVSRDKDLNNDGKLDYWSYWIGKDVFIVRIDHNFDGIPDYCDKVLKFRDKKIHDTDLNCDGSTEFWVEEKDGSATIFIDTNGDRLFDGIFYSMNDTLYKIEHDLGYDGVMNASINYKNGKFKNCEIDTDNDGEKDKAFNNYRKFNGWMKETFPEYTNNYNRIIKQVISISSYYSEKLNQASR